MSSYDIVINTIGTDGFIDNRNSHHYARDGGGLPASVGAAENKMRAYYRYKHLVISLCQLANVTIESVTATGGTASGMATSLNMRIFAADDRLLTNDENNAGQTLSGSFAIKRVIARCLMADHGLNVKGEIYDPTTFDHKNIDGVDGADLPRGVVVTSISVPALAANTTDANAVISVTKV